MEHRHLGRSGLKISEIAYGNWITHGSQVEEDAAKACVAAALDEGITTFDTADVYAGTAAEAVMGRALQGVRRESVEIFTKVYWPTGPGVNDRGLSRKHIMESANASLRRLQTDYVDLYQAHRFDYETPLEETLRAFDDLVRQGKVLYVGVSEWRAEQIADALRIAGELGLHHRIVSNQPQYNMIWRVIEAEVVPLCEKEGIGQVVWSPIAQGTLTGKYLPGGQHPAGSRADDPAGANFIRNYLTEPILSRVQQLRPVADETGLSPAQLAIAWTLQNPNVSAAIVGATRPEQVRENARASGVRLGQDIMRRIDDILGPEIVTDPALTASPPSRP
jgi:aryl-alcohol dehydrogenase-like predicted oxidoreductase